MSPALDHKPTQSEARDRRVAALLSAITPQLPSSLNLAQALELCSAFDQAVEFAAFEGKSVSDAAFDFLADEWGSAQTALRSLFASAGRFSPTKLPVLPQSAAKLLRTNDETVSVAELQAIAEADPTLTAQLLGAANSAIYGSRSEIVRLRDAIMRVGVPPARKLLLNASFSGLFGSESLRRIWEHSQKVASHAEQLARLCGQDPEAAYAAGLLHDIGRIAFAIAPEPMRRAERHWLEADFPLIYSESMAFGNDHAAFGAQLLQSWQLPEEIVAAVRHHHRPECSRSALHAVVHLAETPEEDLWSDMRREAALERSGITTEQLDGILGRIC